jgi:hypothetical protein
VSTAGQMDEGVSRTPKADVAWLGAVTSSEAEVAQPEPSSVQASTSVAGQTEETHSRCPR